MGVWVGERKIASVGVHISHGVSAHGFAVNVDNDLDPFSWVVACGLPEVQMTSMAAEGAAEGIACFRKRVGHRFSEAFGRRQRLVSAARLGIEQLVPADGVGLATFLVGDGIRPDVLARAAEDARLRLAVPDRAHAHPGLGRRWPSRDGGAAAGEVPAHARPVRRARVRRGRDDETAAHRHRRLPGDRARPDRAGQGGRVAATCSRAGASCSASARAGTSQEMRNHGTDPATRHGIMRERVEAMKAIWTRRRGRVPRQARGLRPDLAVAEAGPAPHPPVYVGGNGPRVEDRVLRYGDGWMPNMPDIGELAPRSRRCASARAATFRSPTTARSRRTWTRCADAGVDRALIVLESGSEAEVLASIPSLK